VPPIDDLRNELSRVLDWEDAHVGFDKATEDIPVRDRGARAAGFEHSAWQLLEHLRLAQKDLLDFCVNAQYAHALNWPDDYWLKDPAPPDEETWTSSLEAFRADRDALKALVRNAGVDLFAPVPTGEQHQTYLRAILLVIDHNAYHVGQLVALRRALGTWQ
jgi:uncharacterized damage-inducible protein DinB